MISLNSKENVNSTQISPTASGDIVTRSWRFGSTAGLHLEKDKCINWKHLQTCFMHIYWNEYKYLYFKMYTCYSCWQEFTFVHLCLQSLFGNGTLLLAFPCLFPCLYKFTYTVKNCSETKQIKHALDVFLSLFLHLSLAVFMWFNW